MGVQNIIQNPDEDAQSSDSLLGNGPFFDAADPPVIIDNLSSESEEGSIIVIESDEDVPSPQAPVTSHQSLYEPLRLSWDDLFHTRNLSPHWPPRLLLRRRHGTYRTHVVSSPSRSLIVNEAIANDVVANEVVVNEVVVNEDKQSHQTKNIPTKSRRANIGKKKARRCENARILDILAGGGYYPYDDSEFLSINCPFKFTKVLKNHELAEEILDATLDDLDEYYVDKDRTKHSGRSVKTSDKIKIVALRSSPHHAFDRLDPLQKSFITRRNLPRGMIEYLDTCLWSFFENNPTGTYISPPLTSFERMMLHCLARYYTLISHSFEHCDGRLTKVTNPLNHFSPRVSFTCYLENELWKKLETDSGSKRCRSRRQRC